MIRPEPCASMYGSTALQNRNVPFRLESNTRSQVSSNVSCASCGSRYAPAPFTNTSIRPNAACTDPRRALHRFGVPHVARQANGRSSGCRDCSGDGVRPLGDQIDHRHTRAVACKTFGDLQANAASGAGHDHHAVARLFLSQVRSPSLLVRQFCPKVRRAGQDFSCLRARAVRATCQT